MQWFVLVFAMLFMVAATRSMVAIAARVFSWIPWASFRRVYALLCALILGAGIVMLVVGAIMFPGVQPDLLSPIQSLYMELPTTAILAVGCSLAVIASFLTFVVQGARPQAGVPCQPQAAKWNIARSLKYAGVFGLVLLIAAILQDVELRWRLGNLKAEAQQLADELRPARTPDVQNAAIHYQRAAEMIDDVVAWDKKTFGDFCAHVREPMSAEQKEELARKLEPIAEEFYRAAELTGCRFTDDYQAISPWYDGHVDYRHETAAAYLRSYARYRAGQQDGETAIRCLKAVRKMQDHLQNDSRNLECFDYMWMERSFQDSVACLVTNCRSLPVAGLQTLISKPLPTDQMFNNGMKWSAAVVRSKLVDVYTERAHDAGTSFRSPAESGANSLWGWLRFAAVRFIGCRDDIRNVGAAYRIVRSGDDCCIEFDEEAELRGNFLPVLYQSGVGEYWIIRAEGHRRLANIAIAVGLYRDRNGDWPATSGQIAPNLQPDDFRVPNTNDKFIFKSTDGGLFVYEPECSELFDKFDDSPDWWSEARDLPGTALVLYLGEAYQQSQSDER